LLVQHTRAHKIFGAVNLAGASGHLPETSQTKLSAAAWERVHVRVSPDRGDQVHGSF
jgi:hypothetical protein